MSFLVLEEERVRPWESKAPSLISKPKNIRRVFFSLSLSFEAVLRNSNRDGE